LRSGATKMEPNSFRRLNAVITARPPVREQHPLIAGIKPIAGAPRGRKDVFIRAFSFPSASLRLYDPVSRALEPDVRRREFLGALSRSPAVGS